MIKILLVEDDKSLREIYGVRLLAEGYDIVSAGDGEQALAMAIKEQPQLIISDVMMPKISGFDMLDILRSTTETKNIKVIMMTALSSEDQRARGQALGADRYLVKSQVGIEDVVRTVHEVLADAPISGGAPQPAPAPQPNDMTQPVATSRTAPPIPQRPVASQNVPQRVDPAALSAAPQPAAPVTPLPVLPPAPTPQPIAPQPPILPQPTAPFSTARPANLGERVIHPINTLEPNTDLANRLNQELQNVNSTPAQPTIPQPAPPSDPNIGVPAQAIAQPQDMSAPAVPPPPQATQPPVVPDVAFEEAPLPPRSDVTS